MLPDPATEELLRQTIERFWETFPSLWDQIRGHLREVVAEECDISIEQFHLLRQIRKGINSVSELATARQVSRPAVSQAVDLLVQKGLLIRRAQERDRRYIELALTPGGVKLINAAFEQNRAWMMGRMAALSPNELNSLRQGIEALHKSFQTPA